jgi:hypothetical protein
MNKPYRDECLRGRTVLNSALLILEHQNSDITNQHLKGAIKALERAISVFDNEMEEK